MKKRTIRKLLASIKNPDPTITLILDEMDKDLKSDFMVAVVCLAAMIGLIGGLWIGGF